MMADAAQVVETMDVDAFLAFLDARQPGEHWELHDGLPRLMVGGTAAHARIAGNIDRALFEAAKRRACEPMRGILVAANDHFAFEPDVVVQCGPLGGRERIASRIKVVFEVLSPSTMRYDRGVKFDAYRRAESIEQIVFVYQDSVRVESYFRDGDSWGESPKVLVSRENSFAIPALGTSLPLASIYSNVEPSPLD